MSRSNAESVNEKSEAISDLKEQPPKNGLFSRGKHQNDQDLKDTEDATEVDAPVSQAVVPVSFGSLFRYVQVVIVYYVFSNDHGSLGLPPGLN